MNRHIFFIAVFGAILLFLPVYAGAQNTSESKTFFDLSGEALGGEMTNFSRYQGKVVLATNIALKCGTTPQLHALQALYEEMEPQGLVVLGFPSNDFSKKEPKEHQVIQTTCQKKFGVSFPLFAPAPVMGPGKQPVFAFLTSAGQEEAKGEISFNFEKFLIDKNGKVRERFGPFTGAQSEVLRSRVEELLSE